MGFVDLKYFLNQFLILLRIEYQKLQSLYTSIPWPHTNTEDQHLFIAIQPEIPMVQVITWSTQYQAEARWNISKFF